MKMTFKLMGIIVLYTIIWFVISCGNGDNDDNDKIITPKNVVYISGSYYNFDTDARGACYWKDGVRISLNGDWASAITVYNGSVYIAGNYYDSNDNEIACYWKDGVRVDLASGEFGAYAGAITVYNGSVYVAGMYWIENENGYNGVNCYWKDGVRTDLYLDEELISGGKHPRRIAVLNDSVYVTGSYWEWIYDGYTLHDKNTACYWKDGVLTILAEDTPFESIFPITVSGNSVYIAGSSYINNSYVTWYWKDGVKTEIPGSFKPTAMAVSGGSIHIVGDEYEDYYDPIDDEFYFMQKACYWNDGVMTYLSSTLSEYEYIEANAIAISEGSVYIAGEYYFYDIENDEYFSTACYWKDGIRININVMDLDFYNITGIVIATD